MTIMGMARQLTTLLVGLQMADRAVIRAFMTDVFAR